MVDSSILVQRGELDSILLDVKQGTPGDARHKLERLLAQPETTQKLIEPGTPEEYCANVESMIHFMPPSLQQGLRNLRLRHWLECRCARTEAEGITDGSADWKVSQIKRERLNREADYHLKQVQMLNDFFAPGDTAEKDVFKQEQR